MYGRDEGICCGMWRYHYYDRKDGTYVCGNSLSEYDGCETDYRDSCEDAEER